MNQPPKTWRGYAFLATLLVTFTLLQLKPVFSQEREVDRYYYLDPDTKDFKTIQKKMEDFYRDKDQGRGTGYKQWKRWEYLNQSRLDKAGQITNYAVRNFQTGIEMSSSSGPATNFGNWSPLAPTSFVNGNSGYNPGLGRVNVIAFHPTQCNTIYAGTPSGGLWRTTDGGTTWTPLTDNLPRIGISGIVVHPTNPNHIYILTGDGDGGDTYSVGVYESFNGGTTWTPTGLTFGPSSFERGYKLLMHPSNSSILFAVMSSGLWRSTDAGATWSVVIAGSWRDMEFNPSTPSIAYLSGSTFHRSTDGGGTWTQIVSGVPTGTSRIEMAVSPNNANYVYLISGPGGPGFSRFKGVYLSVDAGLTFSLAANTPNILNSDLTGFGSSTQYTYDLAIAAQPGNEAVVITGGINVWKSINSGSTFTIKSHWSTNTQTANNLTYTHADIHELVYSPCDGKLYCGSDGGIFVSNDHGETFTDLSQGMQIMQFYRIAGYEPDPNKLIGGTQDNGTNLRTSGTQVTHIYGADGMDCAIDHTTPATLYFCFQRGGLRKSTNNGFTSTNIRPSGSSGAWVTPYVMDPTNSQIIYAGYYDIYKTTNGGASWSNLGFDGSGAIAMGTNDAQRIYASSSSTMYTSANGGTSWTNISAGLPGIYITFIAVNPDNASDVFVTLGGFNAGQKVYKSEDAGLTWTNISGTLPDIPVNCIAYEDQNGSPNDALYIGTDIGIFYRDDDIGDWLLYSKDLPQTIVADIEINETNDLIRAGTYGRGIWTSALYATPPTICNNDRDGDGTPDIADPCACDDPLNVIVLNGPSAPNGDLLFHEVVTITSGGNETWEMTNLNSGQVYDSNGNPLSLPVSVPETFAGSGIYIIEFYHHATVGYDADFSNGTDVLNQANSCMLCPTPVPTMSQWGLIFFVLLLGNLGLTVGLRRKVRESSI